MIGPTGGVDGGVNCGQRWEDACCSLVETCETRSYWRGADATRRHLHVRRACRSMPRCRDLADTLIFSSVAGAAAALRGFARI